MEDDKPSTDPEKKEQEQQQSEKSCPNNKFARFFVKEDALDRIPGFRAWKVVLVVMLLMALGLAAVGYFSGAWGSPEKFPLNNFAFKNHKTNQQLGHAWNWIHFMAYYLMALLFPDSWAMIFILGFVWESLEFIAGWGDWADIGFNTAGIALGVFTRKLLVPLCDKATPVKC